MEEGGVSLVAVAVPPAGSPWRVTQGGQRPPAPLTASPRPGTLQRRTRHPIQTGRSPDAAVHVQTACRTRSDPVCGRDRRPQHDPGGLCRGVGGRHPDHAAHRRSPAAGRPALDHFALVGLPGFLRVRVGGPASPCQPGAPRSRLRVLRPRAGRRRRRTRRPGRPALGRRSEDGVAIGGAVALEGHPRRSRLAAVAPGAGAGIGTAAERAGDLPDGAVPGFGGSLLSSSTTCSPRPSAASPPRCGGRWRP